jgi:hypothetical protein
MEDGARSIEFNIVLPTPHSIAAQRKDRGEG